MVNIVNDYGYKFDEEKFIKYIDFLDNKMNNKKDFSVVFLKDEEISDLNLEFRNKNYVTDVLSFPEDDESYMGDILICISKIEEQANEYNHSIIRELYFLLTHGYLHLLGYDHMEKEEEKIMYSLQENLLKEYGIER